MSLLLAGIGTAVPQYSIAQSDALELTRDFNCDTPEQRRMMSVIYRYSGVKEKGSVLLRSATGALPEREDFFVARRDAFDRGPGTALRMERYDREALPLALAAAQRALDHSGVTANDITQLVTITCSGFSAPGFDIGLVQELKLRPETARTQVGFMGCHGFFNGLRVADAFAAVRHDARVLVCSVELCSLHHSYGWHPERVIANGLFADGAAAAVCHAESSEGTGLKLIGQASTIVPDTLDAMSWKIGDHGFEMSLSPKVSELIEHNLAAWIDAFLSTYGLTRDSVGSWAIHPGGPRILDACRKALDLQEAQLTDSRAILAQRGNMSSATIVFLLERILQSQGSRPILAIGFGPGLTMEAMLLG